MSEKVKRLLVRPMKKEDLPAVMAINNENFIDPWTEKNFLYELEENPFATVMVLTYADIVIGYCDFWITDDSAAINQIAIKKELQGHRLGRLLIEDTLARIGGVDEVQAVTLEVRTTNERAIKFYLSYGFDIVLTKKQYYENGDDAYYMMKVMKEYE
jgi:ribosomal-protein-alanine N-acetyltransferase